MGERANLSEALRVMARVGDEAEDLIDLRGEMGGGESGHEAGTSTHFGFDHGESSDLSGGNGPLDREKSTLTSFGPAAVTTTGTRGEWLLW